MSKTNNRLLLALTFIMLISLLGCGKTDEEILNEEKTSDTEITDIIEEKEAEVEENDETASESEEGKIEIGEEMRLEEVKETNTDNTVESIGDVIRLYIVFDSEPGESNLESEIKKLEELLSSDSNFRVRRRDVANNAVVIVITDTSYELIQKISSIKEISILEEAEPTTNGKVSK